MNRTAIWVVGYVFVLCLLMLGFYNHNSTEYVDYKGLQEVDRCYTSIQKKSNKNDQILFAENLKIKGLHHQISKKEFESIKRKCSEILDEIRQQEINQRVILYNLEI